MATGLGGEQLAQWDWRRASMGFRKGTGVFSALALGLAVRVQRSDRKKMVASDVLWLLPSGLYPSWSGVFCLLILASKTDANL